MDTQEAPTISPNRGRRKRRRRRPTAGPDLPLSEETRTALKAMGFEQTGQMRVCRACGQHGRTLPSTTRHPADAKIREARLALHKHRGNAILEAHLHKLV